MIRINLLPYRAVRKKENIRKQLSVYALSVLLVVLLLAGIFLNQRSKLNLLVNNMKSKKKELASYSGTTKKIAELKKKIESTQTKLDVIKKLEKNKTGPVLLLDEISQTVPKEKLWLQSLQEKSGILSLKGSAMDNETLSLFMKNLEKAEHIRSVDLKSAKSKTLSNYKLSIIDFMLSCKIYSYKEKEKKKNKSRRRR
ncbi:MAG: hypothetical protein B1H11_04620 [Desulfobacteraceae bacterium 4484_190.1]|nr:MAG: hypothetical protein B1H11_04620 [Desulfobacteraceae bacterium 4484_190.1]